MAEYRNIKPLRGRHTHLRHGDYMKLLDTSKPISPEDMADFELKYDLKLPYSFVDFYLSQNGGVPDTKKVKGNMYLLSVHQFDDFSELIKYKLDLDEYSVPKNIEHSKTIPFACDQGGNTYALYVDNGKAKVIFYTTSDEMTIHAEWDSFSEFLGSFVGNPS